MMMFNLKKLRKEKVSNSVSLPKKELKKRKCDGEDNIEKLGK